MEVRSHWKHFFYLATLFLTTLSLFGEGKGRRIVHSYDDVLGSYSIMDHTGDDQITEVLSPKNFRINTTPFLMSSYSSIEEKIAQGSQKNLANLMRALRLSNRYPQGSVDYLLWNEQAQFNVPILILSSLYLNMFCQKEKVTTILFSQRDGFHWLKIFKTLFPHYHSVDFMTSRMVYTYPTPEYIEYVRSLMRKKFVITDLHGTGESCLNFFKNHFHYTPLHLALVRRGNLCPGITYASDTFIEMLNCAPYGSLKSLTKTGPVRYELEYPKHFFPPAIACIDQALEFLKSYQFHEYDPAAMSILMTQLMNHSPVMRKYHVNLHGDVSVFLSQNKEKPS